MQLCQVSEENQLEVVELVRRVWGATGWHASHGAETVRA